jgi:hypothetical protein
MMNYLLPIYSARSRRPQRETEREYLMRVAREKEHLERQERRRSVIRKITRRRPS